MLKVSLMPLFRWFETRNEVFAPEQPAHPPEDFWGFIAYYAWPFRWMIAACAVAADAPQDTEGARPALAPAPSFGPAEVTQIQLDALRTNTLINEGIALTFRFASPANRQVTGPLPRFVKMLRSPPYDRLLNHREVVGYEEKRDAVLTLQAGDHVENL